ncbi:peptidase M16 [Vulcanimicrobium alpinum]|uniref:Peptidase M16 n=1 Tax=Vulcanimicrobium alpinum TaxID=3016050 RepID=A0AAN1XUE8_UNVUL|nr:pitrilysin family protein [Vulcanimicrobium alpinum]BDE05229.1 peptidase M16 [Vulcanimicrobium alpinum]
MIRVRTLVCAALAAALAAAPFAPVRAQSPQPAAQVDVTRATLPNGMEVVVLRDTLAPVVATWMNYRVGADDEPITGLAHAQEHMLFRGSKTLTASQFADTTAITGGNFNADTQNEITQYFFEMPSQYLNIALNLERSRATGALDDQKLWDQERGAITQEVTGDNSSATYRLYAKTVEHMFAGTPYADVGLGTVASFKQIQAPDLKAFYAKWYHPNNAIYVIAGNVDPQATIAKVRALYADVPSAPLPPRKPVRLAAPTALTLRDNSSDPITVAFVAYRVPGYTSPDYFASEILNDVLNSQRGALFELQASGKALGTFAQSQTYPEAGLSLVGSAVPVATSGDTAVTDIKNVIENYKKNGLPADLVEVAKQREVAQAQFALNSISNLASTWSQTLAIEHRTPDEDLAGLQKVTLDDVNRVLRTWYDNTTATVAIATPKEAAGSAFGAKVGEDNTVIPTEHTALPAFARNVLKQLRVPEQTIAPVQQTLPNGLKLVVVPTKLTPTVTLRGVVAGNPGVQEPPGKDGLSGIVDGLFAYGTATYDRIAFQTELDKIAATESAGRSFSLDVLSSAFDRGVALLADNELHPAFPADAFAIVKQQTAGSLAGQLKSPDYKAQRALVNALYPAGDPSRRAATPQTVGAVALDDVKSYYAAAFRPDLTTIVVVGDVTPEHARAAVDGAFGAWKATGPTPDLYPKAVPANKPARAVIPATGRIQADVRLGETIALGYNDPDYPLLDLANTVLTGGFYASLLFHDLRELHGYVYTVGSTFNAGRNRSTFFVNYGCDPQNIDRAARLVVDDLRSLQSKPIDAGRLIKAKALVLGQLPVSQESTGQLASGILEYVSTGRSPDQDRIEARAQLAASAAAVRAALKRWIRPDGFVRVVQGPAK